jgi:hypothetical protein
MQTFSALREFRRKRRSRPGATQFSTAILASLAFFALPGCIGDRPDSCQKQSDCPAGFCSGNGFCESECTSTLDCPCGSFCAPGCQICIRNDQTGPATCFPFNTGLTNSELLGACGVGTSAIPSPTAYDSGALGGVSCQLDPVTPGSCTPKVQVKADAGLPNPGDSGADANTQTEADAPPALSDGSVERSQGDDSNGGTER